MREPRLCQLGLCLSRVVSMRPVEGLQRLTAPAVAKWVMLTNLVPERVPVGSLPITDWFCRVGGRLWR
jgi:hypothetical protein